MSYIREEKNEIKKKNKAVIELIPLDKESLFVNISEEDLSRLISNENHFKKYTAIVLKAYSGRF